MAIRNVLRKIRRILMLPGHLLVYLFSWLTMKTLCLLPRRVVYAMAEFSGKIAPVVFPWHRKIIVRNLRLAMPELPYAQTRHIVTNTFTNVCKVAVELSCLPGLRGKGPDVVSSFAELSQEVQDRFRTLLARKKGLLYLTGHLGVWELLPNLHALHMPDIPLSVVVRPLDNPFLDKLINRNRSRLGNRLLPKKNSAKRILEALRRNEAVGILLDQNVCREEGVFVDFFGTKACTNFGLAAIALRTEAPVVPVGLFLDPRTGKYTVRTEPEVPLVRTGSKAEDLRINTANYTRALENMVRKYPHEWLWVHRRWKTRPSNIEAKIYA